MDKINDLYTQLLANVMEIDMVTENIDKAEITGDIDTLESLYKNEFFLYMDHIGIYDDLMNYVEKEPKTNMNEFELAKIKRDAKDMLRVGFVEVQ